VTFENPGAEVGVAGVIDVFGSAAADRAIETPVAVDGEQVDEIGRFGAALGLLAADAFAGVLDDLALGRDALAGVDAPTMNFGLGNAQLKAGVPRVYLGFVANQTLPRPLR